MSCIYNGNIIDSNLSKNARGGTEMMRERLLKGVKNGFLQNVAIHFSRVRKIYPDAVNILYCHDLVQDPENKILSNQGWKIFDHIVFVSHWQRIQYELAFNIPHSMTSVIENAIEIYPDTLNFRENKNWDDEIRFIYHTTPHRGLDIAFNVFSKICEMDENVHFDVFSSFSVYGWEERDKQFKNLFDVLDEHPKITYHGGKPNEEVLDALKKSHFFLYPCTWKETSCIALMEAIEYGVIPIIPDYGALPETLGNNFSINYRFDEDASKHVESCAIATEAALNITRLAPGFMRNSAASLQTSEKNKIDNYVISWEALLKELLQK